MSASCSNQAKDIFSARVIVNVVRSKAGTDCADFGTDVLTAGANETSSRFARGGEGFGDVVLPGEALFICNGPH